MSPRKQYDHLATTAMLTGSMRYHASVYIYGIPVIKRQDTSYSGSDTIASNTTHRRRTPPRPTMSCIHSSIRAVPSPARPLLDAPCCPLTQYNDNKQNITHTNVTKKTAIQALKNCIRPSPLRLLTRTEDNDTATDKVAQTQEGNPPLPSPPAHPMFTARHVQ